MNISNRSQQGFSLLELIISIGLGVFLLAGAVGVFVSSKTTYRLNDEISWIQENGRYALYLLNEDIRMAGYFGCSGSVVDAGTGVSINFRSTLNSTGGFADSVIQRDAIDGFDGGDVDDDFPIYRSLSNLPDSDVITLRGTDSSIGSFSISAHAPGSATITIGNHNFEEGDVIVVSDSTCNDSVVTQISSENSNQVNHNTGGGVSPGNCSSFLGGPVNAGGCPTNSVNFNGGSIDRYIAHAYYVQDSPTGMPTLYRRELRSSGLVDQEIVQGVENIQFLYGVDGDGDGIPERYLNATQIGAPGDPDWGNVISVRTQLLLRSVAEASTEPRDFRFAGQLISNSSDRYIRQEFVMTTKLRNRG